MTKLTTEIVEYITSGWTQWEADHLWEEFKLEEIKPYYPEIYKLIKDVKKLPKR